MSKLFLPSDNLKYPHWDYDKLLETYRISEEIIEQLSPEAVNELFNAGDESTFEAILDMIVEEAYNVLYGQNPSNIIQASNLGYLDKLSESFEESLRCSNLNYFITSILPEFELANHHLQWGELIQKHKYLAILAARGHGKSIAPETKILMFDGSIKLAKDIKIGDRLRGTNNKPRIVKNIGFGIDNAMYRVSQLRGEDYIVNSKHKLTLFHKIYKWNKQTKVYQWIDNEIVDMEINDYIKLSDYQKKTAYLGFKVCSDFEEQNIEIDPYWLGIWLGDGSEENTLISKPDKEIHIFNYYYAKRLGLKVSFGKDSITKKTINSRIVRQEEGTRKNILLEKLKGYDLLFNKHIPEQYFCNSKEIRMQLLAGLLDTDGYLKDNRCYVISQIRYNLILEIKRLAESLGFNVSLTEVNEKFDWIKKEEKNYKSYVLCITGPIHKIPCKIKRKKAFFVGAKNQKDLENIIPNMEVTVKCPLKVENIGRGEYVSITVDQDHRFLLGDGTVTHNSYYFSNAYPIWQLYRYKPKNNSSFEQSKRKGYLFSFSITQAVDLLTILRETIEDIDILRERLYNKNSWSKTEITCKNKTSLKVKGFGSSVRGAHPGFIVIDDGLKENVLYSQVQREKSTNYFHAVIMNMIVPGGPVTVVGTPFAAGDLYGDLKTKENWNVFEYPAIFPNGDILWPNMFSYADLMEKRKSQGTLIFSRELLCRPITSESTIFPIEILNNAFFNMGDVTLVENRESYKKKFSKVVVGADFAISSSVGADYSVFGVWGIDETDTMWLMHFWRKKGASYSEQIAKLKNINANFRPDLMFLEKNQMQQIFVEGAQKENLPVMGHITSSNKNDLKNGLPGLAIDFERGKIKIPIGDQYSKDVADLLVLEFSSVAFTDKGLQGVGEHDDCTMMVWISKQCSMYIGAGQFRYDFM